MIYFFNNSSFQDFEGDWPSSLNFLQGNVFEAILREDRGCCLNGLGQKFPKFVTFILREEGGRNEDLSFIEETISESNINHISDRLRDLLGLDEYQATYKTNETVLGYMIFRAQDLNENDAIYKRPTPLDATSENRFSGIMD